VAGEVEIQPGVLVVEEPLAEGGEILAESRRALLPGAAEALQGTL